MALSVTMDSINSGKNLPPYKIDARRLVGADERDEALLGKSLGEEHPVGL